ncbi:Crp/Fnr family transcriptional regulator [Pedobacter caeni]|uniref:cAMP-binding domain of CRP or a regulatory subunit of cAMP-dependent protein kinases n=1 Tax=Pedobacter caeni TaxID=288992 RepID=A0A1M4URV0_9SPHI|nr:Crp/Fnr family transcriptional regulator [Pedobacter caeni]SHE59330.1 cAMP-binding domain of CRP or a regulatory subunit of cAMP-dependent protein kinases [Pedobacter caeni]
MQKDLLHHIGKFIPLNEAEQQLLVDRIRYEKIPKKGFLLQAGKVCSGRFFVISGCLRQYVMKENESEQIIQFGLPGWWICDHRSLENGEPSEYYVQATEVSEVAIIDAGVQEELFSKIPLLERYFRLIFQRAYDASLTRISLEYCISGEERYHQFAKNFPDFVQKIPQYMLASFLGLTPEFISIIRAKKKR